MSNDPQNICGRTRFTAVHKLSPDPRMSRIQGTSINFLSVDPCIIQFIPNISETLDKSNSKKRVTSTSLFNLATCENNINSNNMIET
jgi:hypothetical protein